MEINFIIPPEKEQDFLNAWCKVHAVPTIEGEPMFTQEIWFKKCLKSILKDIYRNGKSQQIREAHQAEIDDNFITP